ncbi:MAG TPA: hypothetical protein VHZ07_24565 [Bryobacteraceae bacterium]|jgi:hypothetical protein|nr:hypothetical protein [Bryobacteraceae bacterium]
MPEPVICKICGKRRAKRLCPAVHGDICPLCCGTEREVTLSCPLECEYLQEAHKREKPVPVAERDLSNPDIKVTEEFLHSHEELLLFSIYALLQGALNTSGAVDADVMQALESLIQTSRTMASGLIYETRSPNLIAAAIQTSFSKSLEGYRQTLTEEGRSPVRDAEILGILVFLHNFGQRSQNGRPRGRMFIDLLRQMTPEAARVEPAAPSIIL